LVFENENSASTEKESLVSLLSNYENSFADRPENFTLLEYIFRLTHPKHTTDYSRWIEPLTFAVSRGQL
jgi:hypothetical protein